jgi:protein involved in polysaccharide export with SLBB domain
MKIFVRILFILILSQQIWAQGFDNLSNTPATSQFSDKPAQYILGSGDILLVNVNLWGHVQRPGIYSVPSSYTIIDLISSAGGPLNTARLSDVRIVRKDQEVIKVDIEKYLKSGDNTLLPVIQPGDTIIVSGSIQNYFLQIVGLFRDLAIIANVFVLAQRVK